MGSLDRALIAHLEKDGERFEIYVDPDEAFKYRMGESKDVRRVLIVDEIFRDARKGERHDTETLKKTFNTTDPYKIAEEILSRGDVPFTTEQKKKMAEQKLNKIIDIIVRESIDPRTNAPHPRLRIENAIKKLKVHVDPFKPAEAQVDVVVNKLRTELPITFKRLKIAVRVPPEYAQKMYGVLKEYNIKKEEWSSRGELIVIVEIPAGIQGEFYDVINKRTHGHVETRIIE